MVLRCVSWTSLDLRKGIGKRGKRCGGEREWKSEKGIRDRGEKAWGQRKGGNTSTLIFGPLNHFRAEMNHQRTTRNILGTDFSQQLSTTTLNPTSPISPSPKEKGRLTVHHKQQSSNSSTPPSNYPPSHWENTESAS